MTQSFISGSGNHHNRLTDKPHLPAHLFPAWPPSIYLSSIYPSLYLSHSRSPGLAETDMHYSSARPCCHCSTDLWVEGRRAALQSISQGSDTRHNGVCWLDVRIAMLKGSCLRSPACTHSDYPGISFTPATVCRGCWSPTGRRGHLFSALWNCRVKKKSRKQDTFFKRRDCHWFISKICKHQIVKSRSTKQLEV